MLYCAETATTSVFPGVRGKCPGTTRRTPRRERGAKLKMFKFLIRRKGRRCRRDNQEPEEGFEASSHKTEEFHSQRNRLRSFPPFLWVRTSPSADIPRPPSPLRFFTPCSHGDFQAPGKFTHVWASLVCHPFSEQSSTRGKRRERWESMFGFLLTRPLGVVSTVPSSPKKVSPYSTLPSETDPTEALDFPATFPLGIRVFIKPI